MSSQNINTIIFDCFGVIFKPLILGWYKEKRLDRGFVDEKLGPTLVEFDMGRLSEDDLLDYFLQYEDVGLSKDQLRNEIDSYIDIDNDMIRIIQNLKQNNLKVALLSNANHTIFDRKIFQMYPDFKDLFDEIIISSKVQMVKPSPDIFLYTLDKLGTKPAEAIFVDDGAENVQAAHNLGINGHVFTDYKSFLNYLKILGLV